MFTDIYIYIVPFYVHKIFLFIVSVFTFIFDWKTSFKDIQMNIQKGVKLIVGIIIYMGRFASFIY
jgi:hypothetical protein